MDSKHVAKIAIGCAIAVLIPTIILGWWAISWGRGVAKWSEKADEFPAVSELRGPTIPDDENAALVYEQAWDALELTREQRELLDEEDPSLEKLLTIVEENREVLQLLHRAAQMEKCRFEPVSDPNRRIQDLPYTVRQSRDTQKLFRAHALAQSATGDVSGALTTIEDQVRLAEDMLQKPHGVLQFTSGRSQLVVASRTLESVLNAHSQPILNAEHLRAALNDLEPAPALQFALRVNLAQGIETINYAQTHPNDQILEEGQGIDADNPVRGLVFGWNRATLTREMHELFELCEYPWREIADEAEDLPRYNPGYLYTMVLLQYPVVAAYRDEMLAHRELMLTALDIEAFTAEHGRPPESLDELIETEGIDEADYAFDVFSGERLRYRPDEDGVFTLWSIGRDLENDGGISCREARESGDHDLVFRVEPAT